VCGIVGWKSRKKIDKNLIIKMTNVIAHRGPDGEGYYYESNNTLAFAHKRLSIIDPEHGQQPMKNQTADIVVTFNGTIYNFLELRRELIRFGHPIRSYSDTEVLLYSYLQWGEKCLERFNGMFAFVIHDKNKSILFGARDRMGEKPLYYFYNNENFIFASEIKAILASGKIKAKLNNESLHEYLTFQYYLDDNTLFDDILKLKPGHSFILNEKTMKLDVKEYWDIGYDKEVEKYGEDYYVDKLRYLIDDSVALRLRADTSIGSYLSGGIDSSAVVALSALKLGTTVQLETFTGKFAEGTDYDETKFALEVSKYINGNYNGITIRHNDFLNNIEDIIYYMDEPQAGPGAFSQYQVAKDANKKVKVLLSGQGGDEVFLGYTRYFIAYYEKMIKQNINNGGVYHQDILNTITPNLSQMDGYQDMMQSFFAQGLFEEDARRYFKLINRSASNESIFTKEFLNDDYNLFEKFDKIFSKHDTSIVNKMSYYDLKIFLPSLLHVEDRISMAHGLESRAPLIDHRIIEFTVNIPEHIKFKNGMMKYLPKKIFQNVVPKSVLNRKDKKGFPTPTNLWFKTTLHDWIKDLLADKRTLERGFYEKEELIKLVNGSSKFNRSLWGIINLELWHRKFIDK